MCNAARAGGVLNEFVNVCVYSCNTVARFNHSVAFSVGVVYPRCAMLPLWQGKVFVWQPFCIFVVSYPMPPKFSPGGACGSEECKLGLFHIACRPFRQSFQGGAGSRKRASRISNFSLFQCIADSSLFVAVVDWTRISSLYVPAGITGGLDSTDLDCLAVEGHGMRACMCRVGITGGLLLLCLLLSMFRFTMTLYMFTLWMKGLGMRACMCRSVSQVALNPFSAGLADGGLGMRACMCLVYHRWPPLCRVLLCTSKCLTFRNQPCQFLCFSPASLQHLEHLEQASFKRAT